MQNFVRTRQYSIVVQSIGFSHTHQAVCSATCQVSSFGKGILLSFSIFQFCDSTRIAILYCSSAVYDAAH